MQNAHAVRLNRDARSDGVPTWAALNKLRPDAALMWSRGQDEAGDSSTDNQDSCSVECLCFEGFKVLATCAVEKVRGITVALANSAVMLSE